MSRAGLIRLVLVAVMIALLEWVCRSGRVSPVTLIPPSLMVEKLWEILRQGTLTPDILSTLRNIVASATLAVIAGFGLGVVVHTLPRFRASLGPILSSYYALPMFAFYPLLIVVFGIGDGSTIALGFLMGVIGMMVNTLTGLDGIPRVLLKVARIHRMGPVATALRVKLPAAAPSLFTGVRLAIAYGCIGVIGAEFMLAGEGLGYSISFAYNNFDSRTMYALILLVVVVVASVNMALHVWDRRLQERRRR